MSTNNLDRRRAIRLSLAATLVVLVFLLFALGHAFMHPTRVKTRAQRIQAVNHIHELSLSFSITNVAASNLNTIPAKPSRVSH
jgi:hypothetical protein